MQATHNMSRLLPSVTDWGRENPLSRAQPAGKPVTATLQASARSLVRVAGREIGVHHPGVANDSSITLSRSNPRAKLVCVAPCVLSSPDRGLKGSVSNEEQVTVKLWGSAPGWVSNNTLINGNHRVISVTNHALRGRRRWAMRSIGESAAHRSSCSIVTRQRIGHRMSGPIQRCRLRPSTSVKRQAPRHADPVRRCLSRLGSRDSCVMFGFQRICLAPAQLLSVSVMQARIVEYKKVVDAARSVYSVHQRALHRS